MIIDVPDKYIMDVLKSCTKTELEHMKKQYSSKNAKEKIDNKIIALACCYVIRNASLEDIETLGKISDVYVS